MQLTDDQVARFRAEGFASIESLAGADAVADLRETYDRILAKEIDCGVNDRQLGGITRQVMVPSVHAPGIRENPLYTNAHAVASQLLGNELEWQFDMMIFKPAGHPEATPWHQDLSYFRMPFMEAGCLPLNYTVQVWIAVDDADVENGCMHFVPEAHTKPMPEHYIFSGSPDYEGRLLAIRDPEQVLDLDRAVACPVPAGGATVHVEGTPHYTPPNTSPDRDRRAYIVNFRDPSRSY